MASKVKKAERTIFDNDLLIALWLDNNYTYLMALLPSIVVSRRSNWSV